MSLDRSLFDNGTSNKPGSSDKPTPSPLHMNNIDGTGSNGMHNNLDKPSNNCHFGSDDNASNKENTLGSLDSFSDDSDPPAIVIYMVDPFSFGEDNCDMLRLCNIGLLRCFSQILPNIRTPLKNNLFLQTIALDSILELTQSQHNSRMPSMMRGMAFSVYSQVRRSLQYIKDCKTLTGFGPASAVERLLKTSDSKGKVIRQLHQPAYVLAPMTKRKLSSSGESDSPGASGEQRSSVLFVNYCLSEDQHWLLATCCDDRGEILESTIINIEIPNKTRRKKASARRVGLKRLMDWILSVLAMALVPWRLVIGRVGRIGHGELRGKRRHNICVFKERRYSFWKNILFLGWSVLLSRKSLKKASKQLRDMCSWTSEVPTILSACLVSMEPDSHLRLMADQFTPDERFGQTASNCQLSTPKDASCTHVLVFPTSATAQVVPSTQD